MTRTVLTRVEIGLDGVTEMDWLVNVEKRTRVTQQARGCLRTKIVYQPG
jgi:hypothetical protein